MNLLILAVLTAAMLPGQVADYANSGYKTVEGRARVAQTLGAHDREQTQKPRELVKALGLEPGMTAADIGTGVGYMLSYLAEGVGPSGQLVAEDIFPDFLEKARVRAKEMKLENVHFTQGTVKDPMLPANSIDVALVLDVYHHFDYPQEMLAGIARGLKGGGRLAIVDFYKKGFRDPKHIRLDEEEVVKEVVSNGFELVSAGPFTAGRQYIAIFRKK